MDKKQLFIGVFACMVAFLVPFSLDLRAQTAASPQTESAQAQPEAATGLDIGQSKTNAGKDFMIVTANPLATKVGYQILRAGGTAADAAVAVQMVLGLVEPQSSGIGGGAFALYYHKDSDELVAMDGRETAPLLAGKHLFTDKRGQPMDFMQAVIGGRSVGTPGVMRLLESMHKKYGTMPWESLFAPAIDMAERGFKVSPRLSQLIAKDKGRLTEITKTRLYFYPDGVYPLQPGELRKNPLYGVTLRTLSKKGADAFYTGPIAEKIVEAVQGEPDNPGLLSLEDLALYETKLRTPICGPYRSYLVCSMGLPSSGGLTILQALSILEKYNLQKLGPLHPESWHLISEASRLAFADRNHYMADPDFVDTPNKELIDPAYLKQRRALINRNAAMKDVLPGVPPGWKDKHRQTAKGKEPSGTSHFSIVDRYGNIVSMTTTIEGAFGSKLMAEGFLLNNQLTDFSFLPEFNGYPVANQVAGGKRPRSSMAPTIVFNHKGEPVLVIGSAGGSRIIGYVLQRIISVLDWDMPIDQALAAKHILHRGNKLEIEQGGYPYKNALERYGHKPNLVSMTSGLHAIHFKKGKMIGAADPRREGTALGQ